MLVPVIVLRIDKMPEHLRQHFNHMLSLTISLRVMGAEYCMLSVNELAQTLIPPRDLQVLAKAVSVQECIQNQAHCADTAHSHLQMLSCVQLCLANRNIVIYMLLTVRACPTWPAYELQCILL